MRGVEQGLEAGEAVGFVLEATPFYAEQGGQIHDTGRLETSAGAVQVEGVKVAAGFVLHTAAASDVAVSVGAPLSLARSSGRSAVIPAWLSCSRTRAGVRCSLPPR